MKRSLVFVVHLFYGTLATLISGDLARLLVVYLLAAASGARPDINFEVSSFALAFVPIGLVAGYLSFSRLGGKSAFWIFTVPVAVLALRILTFPSESVFTSGPQDGWIYFFGKAVCATSPLHISALYSSASRCVNRMLYLGPCYSAMAYSAGALAKHLRVFESDRPTDGLSALM